VLTEKGEKRRVSARAGDGRGIGETEAVCKGGEGSWRWWLDYSPGFGGERYGGSVTVFEKRVSRRKTADMGGGHGESR